MKIFVLTLLVVGDKSLGDGLTNGIHLSSVTTTLHADADIDILEASVAQKEHGLEDLEAEGLRLQELDGLTIDLDQSTTLLAVRNSDSGFLR